MDVLTGFQNVDKILLSCCKVTCVTEAPNIQLIQAPTVLPQEVSKDLEKVQTANTSVTVLHFTVL